MAGDMAFDTEEYRQKFKNLGKRYKTLYEQRMPVLQNYEKFVNTQLDTLIGETAPAAQDMFRQAKKIGDTYEKDFLPASTEYLRSATGYDTQARREDERGKAMVDVQVGADAAREAALQRLEGYGIDPSQTRSAAMDQNLKLQSALEQVRAGKEAEMDVEERGRAYTRDALDLGADMTSRQIGLSGAASGMLENNTRLAGQTAETFTNLYGTPTQLIQGQEGATQNALGAKQWEAGAKAADRAAEGASDAAGLAGIGQTVGIIGGTALGASIGGPVGAQLGAQLGGQIGGTQGGAISQAQRGGF